MPTARHRTSKRRSARAGELSERQIFKLESGHDFSFYGGSGFEDDDQLADGWRAYVRAGRLDAYIGEHPGRRPWGWWLHDAPEPRRLINAADAYLVLDAANWRGWFGTGKRFLCAPGALFESELDYLTRLDLLTKSESEG